MMLNKRPQHSVAGRFVSSMLIVLSLMAGCGLAVDNSEKLDRARAAYSDGDHRAAMIDTKSVLLTEPDNAEARLLLGKSLVFLGDGVGAEKEFNRAAELGIDRSRFAAELGEALLIQNSFSRILDDIALELASDDQAKTALLIVRGKALLGLGRPVEAREFLNQALADDPRNLEALLALHVAYRLEHRQEEARNTLDLALQHDPDYIPAWIASAALSMSERDPNRSATEYERAIELARERGDLPLQVSVLARLIELRLTTRDLTRARAEIAAYMTLAPGSVEGKFLDARLKYAEQKWTETQEALRIILHEAPEYLPAQLLAGALHLRLNNLGQAELYLGAVVEAAPGNANARKLLAETRLLQQKSSEASAILQPLVNDPDVDSAALAMAARASMDSGESDEAILYLRQRAEGDESNADLWMDLAAAYLANGSIVEGQKILAKIDEQSAENSYRLNLLTVIMYLKSGDGLSALEAADKMLRKWPDDGRLFRLVGGLHFNEKRYAQARKNFETAQTLDPSVLVDAINLARVDLAEGKLDIAHERYLVAHQQLPKNADIMIALAKVVSAQGDQIAAREWLERAVAAESGNVDAHMLLIRLNIANGDFAAAERAAQIAIGSTSANAEIFNLHGWSLLGQGHDRTALKSFVRAAELDASNPEYQLNIARAYLGIGNLNHAELTLENMLTANSRNPAAAKLMAAVKFKLGDKKAAFRIANDLLQRFPDEAEVHALMAELLYEDRQYEKGSMQYQIALRKGGNRRMAIRAFHLKSIAEISDPTLPLFTYLETAPDDQQVSLLLAQELQSENNISAAIEVYERILLGRPDDPVALNNFAWALFESGDPRAITLARRAYALAPNNAAVADTLGWILVDQGNLQEAIPVLRTANRSGEASGEFKYHLAVALAASGEKNEARLLLQEALSLDEEFTSRRDAESLLGEIS